jgi:DNA-binding CsgD family transcriptional regulator
VVAIEIIGRDEELVELRGFFDAIDRVPAACLLEGEPGIGKTVLWRAGLELARERDLRVLTAIPATAETRLSFAALADLLGPVLADVLASLPAPQRRALEVALLLDDAAGSPPDQRAVAFAFLGAIRALTREGPVVVAVDDVQWLDGPSAFMVEFALRRLREEPVVFFLTLRTGGEPASLGLERALQQDALLRLSIGPLSLGALHRLLRDRFGQVLSRPNLRRVHRLSDGNPFFALELARALERGSIRLAAGEPLPGMLGTLVRDRLAVLPGETRDALLAASALSQPTMALVAAATDADPEARLTSAFAAHVIELDGDRIRFTHPLLASGVYAAATAEQRRVLHRRLAVLVPDLEEHARHLALGAEAPDADVASALERAAERAHARGALPAAVELSEQARRLTPLELEDMGHRRTIQAAGYAWEAGDSDRARELLGDTASPGRGRGEVLYWLGMIEEYEGDRREAVELYRRAGSEMGNDIALRAKIEDGLASALFLMRSDLSAAAGHARAAVSLAEQAGEPGTQIACLSQLGMIDAVTGGHEWREALELGRGLEGRAGPIPVDATTTFALAVVLSWTDELGRSRELFGSLLRHADERGEESGLPWILAFLGWVEFLAGRLAEASRYAEEGKETARQTGQEPQRVFALAVRALVRAIRGDVEGARVDAGTAVALADERGVMVASILATTALGLLELSLGNPGAAHRQLGPLVERLEHGGVREPGSMRFVFDDVEALIALGRLDDAGALLDVVEPRARRLDRASALAVAARCRGLLAAARGDPDAALAWLQEALVQHGRVPMPFEEARTLLALGVTRRRARMKRPAREALERALAEFQQLGAWPWADLARGELARVGGRPPSTGELTETERRIAALAAEGRSNKEIATALFVTPKTVGTQLSRIYRKVGVHSRTELARRLSETPKV